MSRNDAETRLATRTKRGLGAPAITLMIIAAAAPMTVVAAGGTTAYGITQSIAVPIGYIVLCIALAIFAIGYTAMSRYVTNAGAFYAYAARGAGRPLGVGTSIIALVTYNCMQIGIYGIFGSITSSFLQGWFGWEIPWWVFVLLAIVLIGVLGVNKIDISAKVLGILVSLEFVIVVIFDFAGFTNPAEGFTAQPLSPVELFTPAIGAVLVFGIAGFMGFEQAAIYGEEAKDPKRTVARATFAAVILIGVFYAVSTWALALAIGPDTIISGVDPEMIGPPLFFAFVGGHLGTVFVDIAQLLFITSSFAALLSFHNVVARYIFSLGRERLLPRPLALTTRHNAPWAGSLTQTILAIVIVGIFAVAGADPVTTLFNWLTNTGAMGLVLMMMIISAAVIGFFWKNKQRAGVGARIIAPVIAFVFLAIIYTLIVLNFNVLMGTQPGDVVNLLFPLLIVLAGVLGIIWAFILRVRRPSVYERIGYGAPDPSVSESERSRASNVPSN